MKDDLEEGDLETDELDASAFIPWEPSERESFFDAIVRHRRATWRVSIFCVFAALIAFLVLPVVLAPLFCGLTIVMFDFLNLFVPKPDLMPQAKVLLMLATEVVTRVASVFDLAPSIAPGKSWFTAAVVKPAMPLLLASLLPSVIALSLVVFAVKRALALSPLLDASINTGRRIDATKLREQRMRNTIEELCMAALLPPPRIVVIDSGRNAAAIGKDSKNATLLIGSSLLETLNRDQTQALASMLVASIANGDLKIGYRTTTLSMFFVLIQRCCTGYMSKKTSRNAFKLCKAVFFPTRENAAYLLAELAKGGLDDVGGTEIDERRTGLKKTSDFGNFVRAIPGFLMFPVALAGLVVSLLYEFALRSAIGYLWRQRKYKMDAVAVKFLRDADALVSVLAALKMRAGEIPGANWSDHMYVLSGSQSVVSVTAKAQKMVPLPSADARQKALVTMGARNVGLTKTNWSSVPLWTWIVLAVLLPLIAFLLVVLVFGMMGLAMAFSIAFSGIPTAILHAILR